MRQRPAPLAPSLSLSAPRLGAARSAPRRDAASPAAPTCAAQCTDRVTPLGGASPAAFRTRAWAPGSAASPCASATTARVAPARRTTRRGSAANASSASGDALFSEGLSDWRNAPLADARALRLRRARTLTLQYAKGGRAGAVVSRSWASACDVAGGEYPSALAARTRSSARAHTQSRQARPCKRAGGARERAFQAGQ